jgi:hypothetical protein
MSPVIELLDQLNGSDQAYLLMERQVFEGDRARALHSMERMLADGLIVLAIDGRQVEAWKLVAWERTPNDPGTTASLEQVKLSLTDRGGEWLTHGR